jgi:glycosyltransferase involved in cell wall biosynthesis
VPIFIGAVIYYSMNVFNITAIIPVLNRPKNVSTLINSFLETSPLDRVKILFVTSFDCEEEVKEIKKFSGPIYIGFAPNEILSWSQRINWGIIYSNVNNNSNNWILCGADDLRFLPNWFEEAEKASKDFDGVIGTNDLGNPRCIMGIHSTHPIVSRKYIMEQGTIDGELGKLCCELYRHNYADDDLVLTAKKRNAWKHASYIHIEHLHPAWQKANWDSIYQIGNDNWNHDQQLFEYRKRLFNF